MLFPYSTNGGFTLNKFLNNTTAISAVAIDWNTYSYKRRFVVVLTALWNEQGLLE